jgi:hypothetical protein
MGPKIDEATTDFMVQGRRTAPVQEASELADALEDHAQRLLETETRIEYEEYKPLLKIGPSVISHALSSPTMTASPRRVKRQCSTSAVPHLASPGNAISSVRSPRGPIVKSSLK